MVVLAFLSDLKLELYAFKEKGYGVLEDLSYVSEEDLAINEKLFFSDFVSFFYRTTLNSDTNFYFLGPKKKRQPTELNCPTLPPYF